MTKQQNLTTTPRAFVRVPLDGLGVSEKHTERAVRLFRGELEQAVSDAYGGIDVTAALAVQSAGTHEQIARRWAKRRREMEESGDWAKLTVSQQLAVDEMIGRSRDKRDAAVRRLDLPSARERRDELDELFDDDVNGKTE